LFQNSVPGPATRSLTFVFGSDSSFGKACCFPYLDIRAFMRPIICLSRVQTRVAALERYSWAQSFRLLGYKHLARFSALCLLQQNERIRDLFLCRLRGTSSRAEGRVHYARKSQHAPSQEPRRSSRAECALPPPWPHHGRRRVHPCREGTEP
jgi:hypothetical protein